MLRFFKMQGCGNDYIFIDCRGQSVPHPHLLARRVSDRHFGVGSDGLVLLLPAEGADLAMRIFNADGSEAEMCGNGRTIVLVSHGLRAIQEMATSALWLHQGKVVEHGDPDDVVSSYMRYCRIESLDGEFDF